MYEEIGELTAHDTRALFLDTEYGYALMYHGQISGDSWPNRDDLAAEAIDGRPAVDAETRYVRDYADWGPRYFVVTDLGSLEASPDLQEMLERRAHAGWHDGPLPRLPVHALAGRRRIEHVLERLALALVPRGVLDDNSQHLDEQQYAREQQHRRDDRRGQQRIAGACAKLAMQERGGTERRHLRLAEDPHQHRSANITVATMPDA